MTWYERYKGGYRAIWRDASGAKKKGPKCGTELAARAWAIDHAKDAPPNPLISEVLDEWARLRASDRNVSKCYLLTVQDRLTSLCARRQWTHLSHLNKNAIDDWRLDTGGTGVRRSLAYLLSVLRYMHQERGQWMDPRLLVYRLPRQRRTVAAPHLIQVDKARDVLEAGISWGLHAHAILHYLSVYGARPSSACTLPISAIDLERGILTMRAKTSGQWQHPLLPETISLFSRCAVGRDPDEPIFLCPFTGRSRATRMGATRPWLMTIYGSAQQLGRWYAKKIGRPILGPHLGTIYHLKRYAITMMLRAGIDPQTVALFTGHLTLSQVLVYLRSDEVAQQAAMDRIRSAHVPPPLVALAAVAEEIALPPLPPPLPPPAPSDSGHNPLSGR